MKGQETAKIILALLMLFVLCSVVYHTHAGLFLAHFTENNVVSVGESQNFRQRSLQRSCHRLNRNSTLPEDESEMRKFLDRVKLLYSDKYKFMVCNIPKCGCSSIKKLLLVIERLVNETAPQDVSSTVAHHRADERLDIKLLKNFSEISKRMESYTKLIVVRDPFYRLLSAYRNKMEVETPWNSKFATISRKIHAHYSAGDSGMASFEEFLAYINKKTDLNRHWDFYHRLCSPCVIKYDFIGHIETIEDDMSEFFKMVGIKNVTFPHNYEASKETDSQKVERYYRNVSKSLIRNVYRKYETDFDFFGFEKPKIL